MEFEKLYSEVEQGLSGFKEHEKSVIVAKEGLKNGNFRVSIHDGITDKVVFWEFGRLELFGVTSCYRRETSNPEVEARLFRNKLVKEFGLRK
ncbi:MAG: hypothetical protein LBN08_00105 [Lactobacillales bacterium]|jgi:hypothetical protein|nr:hypothetical protein [Lactobacillales bacterium]